MPKLGCISDVETYNTLIDGLCKKGKIEKPIKANNEAANER